MTWFKLAEATTTTTDTQQGGLAGTLITFVPLILIFVVMYFLMIRPQKKQQKEEQKMRSNLRVGDEITTIGGICGRVVNVKENRLTIETGAERNKITILKAAVSQNHTVHESADLENDDDDDDEDED